MLSAAQGDGVRPFFTSPSWDNQRSGISHGRARRPRAAVVPRYRHPRGSEARGARGPPRAAERGPATAGRLGDGATWPARAPSEGCPAHLGGVLFRRGGRRAVRGSASGGVLAVRGSGVRTLRLFAEGEGRGRPSGE